MHWITFKLSQNLNRLSMSISICLNADYGHISMAWNTPWSNSGHFKISTTKANVFKNKCHFTHLGVRVDFNK